MSKNPEESTNNEVKEGVASKIGDGIAGTSVGIVKTIEEVAVAPIRIVARTIDGAVQGVKKGIDNSKNPLEAATKPVVEGLVGSVKGIVKGVEKSAASVGEGILEIGKNINKVGETMIGKNEQ